MIEAISVAAINQVFIIGAEKRADVEHLIFSDLVALASRLATPLWVAQQVLKVRYRRLEISVAVFSIREPDPHRNIHAWDHMETPEGQVFRHRGRRRDSLELLGVRAVSEVTWTSR